MHSVYYVNRRHRDFHGYLVDVKIDGTYSCLVTSGNDDIINVQNMIGKDFEFDMHKHFENQSDLFAFLTDAKIQFVVDTDGPEAGRITYSLEDYKKLH